MLSSILALALQAAPAPAPVPATPAPAPVVSPEGEDEKEFFAMFDTDQDGAIAKAEFDAVAARVDAEAAKQVPAQKGQVASGLATAFALMDQNKDGRITRAEFRALTQAAAGQ